MSATLNVRMDAVLKQRGDAVLKANGISVTEAVRMLWQELAESRQLPVFMETDQAQDTAKKAKRNALDQLGSFPPVELSSASDQELKDLLYEGKLRDYEALSWACS